MPPEIIEYVLPLSFLGICGLIGEIIINGHRDRVAGLQKPTTPASHAPSGNPLRVDAERRSRVSQ